MTRDSLTDEQRQLAREQLEVVTASPVLATAPRLVRLLRYLVEAELEGHGADLNQFRIATEVMERDTSFDPSSDSGVRVEAGRLRAKLREYYDVLGTGDVVRFELPKGRYNPEIHFHPSTPETARRLLSQEIRFCRAPDGTAIAYATSGEGPTLVKAANWLSHLEFDCSSPVWAHWWRDLSARFRLVRYDERGCGLSDWDVREFEFRDWVQDLECVVEAADADRFALLGISQGAGVAITYAIAHPERVSHLILYGGFAQGRCRRRPDQTQEGQMLEQLVSQGWGRPDPAFRRIFASLFAPDATAEQLRSFDELQLASTTPENAKRFVGLFNEIDVTAALPAVTTPTLVLHARDELEVPLSQSRLLAASIPGAQLRILEGRNHILAEEEPAWPILLEEIERFVGR